MVFFYLGKVGVKVTEIEKPGFCILSNVGRQLIRSVGIN
jgi:hypothetical protein